MKIDKKPDQTKSDGSEMSNVFQNFQVHKEDQVRLACLVLACLAVLALACTESVAVRETAGDFFHYVDTREYDKAYALLTADDTSAMTLRAFTVVLESEYERMFYGGTSDSAWLTMPITVPDSILASSHKNPAAFYNGFSKAYVVREVRRVPDYLAMLETHEDMEVLKRGRKMRLRAISGDCPTVLDSSRFVTIVLERGKPRVRFGARLLQNRKAIEREYQEYLSDSLMLRAVGSGNVYRTISYDVVGCVKYVLENRTNDTLRWFQVRGKFRNITTEPKYIDFGKYGTKMPPKSEVAGKIYFSDDFLGSMLGYYRDDIYVPVSLEIEEYPSWGRGPDWDRLAESRPNTVLGIFCNPIKHGVPALYFM